MGNVRLNSKQVGSQDCRRVMATLDPTCLHKFKSVYRTLSVKMKDILRFLIACYMYVHSDIEETL